MCGGVLFRVVILPEGVQRLAVGMWVRNVQLKEGPRGEGSVRTIGVVLR